MLRYTPKVPEQPMPDDVWEEYSYLIRRLDFLGWRYSAVWKYRKEEIKQMFAEVITDDDDLDEVSSVNEKQTLKSFRKLT
jgi:hypothetical protein